MSEIRNAGIAPERTLSLSLGEKRKFSYEKFILNHLYYSKASSRSPLCLFYSDANSLFSNQVNSTPGFNLSGFAVGCCVSSRRAFTNACRSRARLPEANLRNRALKEVFGGRKKKVTDYSEKNSPWPFDASSPGLRWISTKTLASSLARNSTVTFRFRLSLFAWQSTAYSVY